MSISNAFLWITLINLDKKTGEQIKAEDILTDKNKLSPILEQLAKVHYKVEEGQTLEIDFRDVKEGDTLTFDRVLAVSGEGGFKLGKPTVDGASVSAKVLGETKGDKIYVQKFRRRKNSKRRTGHRQKYVQVKIESIA